MESQKLGIYSLTVFLQERKNNSTISFKLPVLPNTKPAFVFGSSLLLQELNTTKSKTRRGSMPACMTESRMLRNSKFGQHVIKAISFVLVSCCGLTRSSLADQLRENCVQNAKKSTWIRQPVIKTIMKQIHPTDYICIYLKLPD